MGDETGLSVRHGEAVPGIVETIPKPYSQGMTTKRKEGREVIAKIEAAIARKLVIYCYSRFLDIITMRVVSDVMSDLEIV